MQEFIGLFGEGVVHWPTVFSVGLFPIIVIAYTLLAYRKEERMLKEFGEKYRALFPVCISTRVSLHARLRTQQSWKRP